MKFDRLHNPSAGGCLVCGVADSEDGRGGRGGGRTRGMTRAGSHLGDSSIVRATSKRLDCERETFFTAEDSSRFLL